MRARRWSRLQRETRRWWSASAVLAVLALASAGPLVTGALASPAGAADAVAPAFTESKDLSRDLTDDTGTHTVDTRHVTLDVDRTTGLRGREVVKVSWSGAHPTGGRTASPYSLDGIGQEYPVMLLECRGTEQTITPETCFTTSYTTRFGYSADAIWSHDLYADPPSPVDDSAEPGWPTTCTPTNGVLFQHLTPFIGVDGIVYDSCNDKTQSPDMAIGSALPPNDLAAFTAPDGTGSVSFEVRTATENGSLGCNPDVPCALVAIPIMGVSCKDADPVCNATGQYAPGAVSSPSTGYDEAVSGKLWWSASNWRNRFVVPLTFAPLPNTCDILDKRDPVSVLGSEVMTQAAMQWSPAFCLRQDRFKFLHDPMPESTAVRTMRDGGGAAAFVSNAPDASSTDGMTLGYAPVAVSGWGIGFVADLADNKGEATQLRLTPRLLAKLLTNSYPGTTFNDQSAAERKDLVHNPYSLNVDPEFQQLNPGIPATTSALFATMLSLNVPSDVITDLTAYINADPEARAFLDGKPDPWGMTVNTYYKGIKLPLEEWPQLDGWVAPSGATCDQQNPTSWFLRIASPIDTMDQIAQDVMDAWPTTSPSWDYDPTTATCKPARAARESFGSRFMLGVVALADADRYGVNLASLRTAGTGAKATFVAPSDASLGAALTQAKVPAPGAPVALTAAAIAKDKSAYPGTMVVHVAAPLTGMDKAAAKDIGDFVDISTTEGQLPGTDVGQLPEGYYPMTADGPAAPLLADAKVVAAAIRAQQGTIVGTTASPSPTPTPTPADTGASDLGPGAGTSPDWGTGGGDLSATPDAPAATSAADTPPAPAPEAKPFPSASPKPVSPGATARTKPVGAAGAALPGVLGVGAAAALGAPVVRRIGAKKVLP
ncbi:MAG: hypothetical protein FWF90_06110 [Promicromonosporaceae bacterium]|nr:hypothetical protein [Promicromonosporaceae bacterium]